MKQHLGTNACGTLAESQQTKHTKATYSIFASRSKPEPVQKIHIAVLFRHIATFRTHL
ncbi:MAG: hypothetical protein IJR49_00295 [Treponema sp.]|nr:hypothetical protein [Treponema sp.]